MAALRFSTVLAARKDKTQGSDGFSYHHILPWRYYFMAGQIMARYAKLRIIFHGQTLGSAAFQATLRTIKGSYSDRSGDIDSKRLGKEFGSEFEAFLNEVAPLNISSKQALDLCANMHGDGIVKGYRDPGRGGRENFNPDTGNSIRTLINNAADFDLDHIGNHCGAPSFGGFLGPAPEKRRDDMGSIPEPVRPQSCNAGQWSVLSLLGAVMESCCPEIGSATAGQTLNAAISGSDFGLLVNYLTKLTTHYNQSPVPFAPADWAVNNKSWIWVDPPPKAPVGTNIGAIFSVATSAETGGQRVRFDNLEATDRRAKLFNPKSNDRKIFEFLRS